VCSDVRGSAASLGRRVSDHSCGRPLAHEAILATIGRRRNPPAGRRPAQTPEDRCPHRIGSPGAFSKRRTGHPRQLVLAAAREVNPEPRADLLKARSTNVSEWYEVIQATLLRILDDVNYLAAAIFLDVPPSQTRSMKDMLGIPEDEFSAVPDFPTPQMLEVIRAGLRRICGRPKA
jgi:hypothetical protein